MWRAGVDVKASTDYADDDDAWETDPDFVVSTLNRMKSLFRSYSIGMKSEFPFSKLFT